MEDSEFHGGVRFTDSSRDQIAPGFGERLRRAIGHEPESSFGTRVGIPKATLSEILNGVNTPRTPTLYKIARHTDISLNWLLTGKGAERVSHVSRAEENEERYLSDFTLVPRYEVTAAAGPGFHVRSERVVTRLAFKTSWVMGVMGLDPDRLALVGVEGDSMEPSLKDGDILLLDMRDQQVRNDAIYVLRREDALIAKRLQRGYDGSVIIKSDNPVYEREVVPEAMADCLQIIGRVVWAGRRL
ncbi:MAG: helix-turn-helix domain-containing protein [Magnetococcales bacterium]|nr:helix-turn-helix domain-containing protein [Magnetococcales bacterium]